MEDGCGDRIIDVFGSGFIICCGDDRGLKQERLLLAVRVIQNWDSKPNTSSFKPGPLPSPLHSLTSRPSNPLYYI